MRTLVVSDFHLGARRGNDVLRRPEPLARLLGALESVDRLVLLGDVIELLERRPERALALAAPVLNAIGAALGPEREVIFVPGNHDRLVLRPWLREHAAELTPASDVPSDATPMLERVVAELAPAVVRVSYPGVWLSDGVWATHGHYLDRHLLPRGTVGITRGLLRRPPRDQARPADYELRRSPSVPDLEALLGRWLPAPVAGFVKSLAALARAATMPGASAWMLHPRMAPLTARLLGVQMQRASIPALIRAVRRLGVDAEWVVFGHVHRLGPLEGDRPGQWQGLGGRPQVANTGSWLYEPLVVHRALATHPYWPGGAIVIDDDDVPRARGLLDGLDAEALR